MEDSTWENSLWYAMKKCDVAWFGIKPFASGSLFKGGSAPDDPNREEDDKIARLTIRAILTNPVITAPIPGIIHPGQVDNVAMAVLQRRALDVKEQAELDAATDRAFAGADTWATSYTVGLCIEKMGPYDVVICGLKTTDGDTGQVGPELAQHLGVPHVCYCFTPMC